MWSGGGGVHLSVCVCAWRLDFRTRARIEANHDRNEKRIEIRMANPRKFSEKIALHNQKQAEETAEFEKIMREVSNVTSKVSLLVSFRSRILTETGRVDATEFYGRYTQPMGKWKNNGNRNRCEKCKWTEAPNDRILYSNANSSEYFLLSRSALLSAWKRTTNMRWNGWISLAASVQWARLGMPLWMCIVLCVSRTCLFRARAVWWKWGAMNIN